MISPHTPGALAAVAAELRAHGAVFVIGAGISHRAGYPLHGQLAPLLWHALDQKPRARAAIAATLSVPDGPAKFLIGEDDRVVAVAFEHLSQHPDAARAFQRAFRARDRQQLRQSIVHDVIARLYHEGVAEVIINFNWDRQLERSYLRLYGRTLRTNHNYFKPHGDAEHLEQLWTLPGSCSGISTGLRSRLTDLAQERPRVLVLIGYSESDSDIVSELIEPLSSKWIVVRISPGAKGEWAIDAPAEIVLPELAKSLCNESWSEAWEYVSFDDNRGLNAALNGRGLRGVDAKSCPRLFESDITAAQLRAMRSARIAGPSGAGKSLVAYQAAGSLNDEGFEVVRLITNESDTADELLQNLRFPTLALIDDAHLVSPQMIRRLEEKANGALAVLSVWPDSDSLHLTSGSVCYIDPERAVASIATTLLRHRKQTLAEVHRVDDVVSDAPSGESLERRIENARLNSKTPWQFCFTVGGGWRRSRIFATEASAYKADLLLTLIAMLQIANLDAGPDPNHVRALSRIAGYDDNQFVSCLRWLAEQRLVLSIDDLRCPHQRFASALIGEIYNLMPPERRGSFRELARAILTDSAVPLAGLRNLLHELRFSWYWMHRGLLDPVSFTTILDRCFTAEDPRERMFSMLAISELFDFSRDKPSTILYDRIAGFAAWLDEAVHPASYGLGMVLNDLINDGGSLGIEISRRVDPIKIAALASNAITDSGYTIGHLLHRLSMLVDHSWRSSFNQSLNRQRILDTVRGWNMANISGLAEYLCGILSFDRSFSLDLLEQAVPNLRNAFADSPVNTYDQSTDLFRFLRIDNLFSPPSPSVRERRLAQQVLGSVSAATLARCIESGSHRELERAVRFMRIYATVFQRRARKAARLVSLKSLSLIFEDKWSSLPGELSVLIWQLWALGNASVKEFVEDNAHLIKVMPGLIALISPAAAASILDRGGKVSLRNVLFGWTGGLELLKALPTRASSLLEQNIEEISVALRTKPAKGLDHCERFLLLAEQFRKGFLCEVVRTLTPQMAREAWISGLRGSRSAQRLAAIQIEAALTCECSVTGIAAELRRRFPSSSR